MTAIATHSTHRRPVWYDSRRGMPAPPASRYGDAQQLGDPSEPPHNYDRPVLGEYARRVLTYRRSRYDTARATD